MPDKPVLVVVDEKNLRATLSQALETMHLDVHTAHRGEDALTKLPISMDAG